MMNEQLKWAIDLVESGQYEQGIEHIKQVLQGADEETSFEIALLYQEWGMVQEAHKILMQLHKRHPGDSHILMALAEIEVDLDKEDQAIEWLLTIHQLDENYLSAQVLLADLYQAQGLEEAAERRLINARKLAPNEPLLTFALAEFYATTGQAGHAVELYKSLIDEPDLEHENIELKLAEVLSYSGAFEEALNHYKKGLEKTTSIDGLFGYAVTAVQVRKFQTAIQALEELKGLDPQYSTLYPLLAKAYEEEGAIEEALETVRAGIKVDKFNEQLLLRAADLSMKVKDVSTAENYLVEALNKDPENIDALKKLVEIKREKEAFDDIISLLNDEQMTDPELLWYLASAYVENDALENARNIYQQLALHFNENAMFLKEYGEVQWQLGVQDEAVTLFGQALKLDPEDEDLRAFLERI